MVSWSNTELEQYSCQIILPDIGIEGQEKICNAKVLVIGAGGLGSPVLLYLSAAGIGLLEILDFDTVNHSNLHRQILHRKDSIGLNKSISAKQTLKYLNPNLEVIANQNRLTQENALKIIKPYDFILDCSDNFYTKYLINDICQYLNKPYNIAGAIRYQGQSVTIVPNTKSPCYRCLFSQKSDQVENCVNLGILGTVVGIIGLFQATETLKYLSGQKKEHRTSLLTFNAKTMETQKFFFSKDPNCLICSLKNQFKLKPFHFNEPKINS